MHILETYSLLSGAKIDKCFISTKPYSLPFAQYITFHADCMKAPARQYKFWHEVLALLKNNSHFNLPIVQIGDASEHRYEVDLHLLGKTNIHELASIIAGSSLHIGYDSLPMHLASHFDIKMVVLFAYFAKSSRPYFSTPSNIRILEPDFSVYKPSLNYTDPHELINTISPNIIYNHILELLGIPK